MKLSQEYVSFSIYPLVVDESFVYIENKYVCTQLRFQKWNKFFENTPLLTLIQSFKYFLLPWQQTLCSKISSVFSKNVYKNIYRVLWEKKITFKKKIYDWSRYTENGNQRQFEGNKMMMLFVTVFLWKSNSFYKMNWVLF